MMDLPRKEREITVDVGKGATIRMATLSSRQMVEIMEAGEPLELPDGKPGFRIAQPQLVEYFAAQVRGASGIQVEGEPFDAGDPDHVRSIPTNMQLTAMMELFHYDADLPERTRGNSTAPAEHSPEGSAPSGRSTGAKRASS